MRERGLEQAWSALPAGARAALEQQWAGVAAGGLPCGAAVVDAGGGVLCAGRNHTYDPAGGLETRSRYPLQHTRLAHAELNALSLVPTELAHEALTLWSTQHPCAMCAAAVRFVGVGKVVFLADDLSDDSSWSNIVASRGPVPYEPFGDLLWWTVSNLLFLYTPAVLAGAKARNLAMNCERYPELIGLTLELAQQDTLACAARSGAPLPVSLEPHLSELVRVAAARPRPRDPGAAP